VSETQALFAALREAADAATTAAIERLVKSGADRNLVRINVLAFAAARGLPPENAQTLIPREPRRRRSPSLSGSTNFQSVDTLFIDEAAQMSL
jgi:Family of unknown function (DUF5939)